MSLAAAICHNIFRFLSLLSSLACAPLATILQQPGGCQYLQSIPSHSKPEVAADARAYMNEGLHNCRASTFIEAILALLHGYLFLFVKGLVQYICMINRFVALVILGLITIVSANILSQVYSDCDRLYHTALASFAWMLVRELCTNLLAVETTYARTPDTFHQRTSLRRVHGPS